MTSRSVPSAVFFDVGNTLIYPYPSVSAVCREILLDAGHRRELAEIDELMPMVDEYYEDRYRADDTFWTSEEQTSDVWVGMYSLLFRRLEIEEDAEAMARSVYQAFGDPSRWRAYDDVVPALRLLRDRGIKTAIISNWDRRLAGLIDGLGLGELLDAVVSSAEVGLHKPDPRIFELACGRLGVKPAECAHVGDHYYADYLGARTTGLEPVMIDRRGGCLPAELHHIRTLDELSAVLGLET